VGGDKELVIATQATYPETIRGGGMFHFAHLSIPCKQPQNIRYDNLPPHVRVYQKKVMDARRPLGHDPHSLADVCILNETKASRK